jgi:hypothetical protein
MTELVAYRDPSLPAPPPVIITPPDKISREFAHAVAIALGTIFINENIVQFWGLQRRVVLISEGWIRRHVQVKVPGVNVAVIKVWHRGRWGIRNGQIFRESFFSDPLSLPPTNERIQAVYCRLDRDRSQVQHIGSVPFNTWSRSGCRPKKQSINAASLELTTNACLMS